MNQPRATDSWNQGSTHSAVDAEETFLHLIGLLVEVGEVWRQHLEAQDENREPRDDFESFERGRLKHLSVLRSQDEIVGCQE